MALGLTMLGGSLALAVPSQVAAQEVGTPRPLGESKAQALDAALAQLARNPRDIDALIGAGRAALALGDTDAATGFFSRADRLAPGTPRVEAGLAVAKVRARDPLAAMPLFDMAAKGSALEPDDIADRGLAYDLVGDNVTAQRYYREAQADGASLEATRRLVLSLAIAGDRAGSDAAVGPLLDRQDRAGARTHAFALAILGREDEAVALVQGAMPADLASAIAPYLRYMRKLTPAQQAAAANLGEFPHAADIGHDDPRIAQYAAEHRLRHLASAEAASGTAGNAQSGRGKSRPDRQVRKPRPVEDDPDADSSTYSLPSAPAPSRVERAAPPEMAAAAPAPSLPPPTQAPAPPAVASQPAPPQSRPATPAPQPYGPVEESGVAPPPLAVSPVPATQSSPPATVAPPPAPALQATPPSHRPSFAEAFGAFGKLGPMIVAPSAGAVDVRKIAPTRPVPKAPPPPAHPSRIWVQLGVGRDTDRLGFDWHRLNRDEPELFERHKPFVSAWGRSNRLLTGPFETQKSAESFLEKVHKAGDDGAYVWTSPAGQVVDPLDAS